MTDERPPMKQEDHPEHNMPPSEYEGETSPVTYQDVGTQGASLIDRTIGPRSARAVKKRKMSGGDSAVGDV